MGTLPDNLVRRKLMPPLKVTALSFGLPIIAAWIFGRPSGLILRRAGLR